MKYSKEALIELVKVNMEESSMLSGAGNISILEGVGIEHYIGAKLSDAVIKVFAAAPVYLLEQTDLSAVLKPERFQNGSGQVVLPDDLLRMSLFKMRGWRRGVTNFLNAEHPAAELQDNNYTMGGVSKPEAVILRGDGVKRILKYYSLPAELRDHQVEEALYVKIPDLSSPIEINEILLPSVTYAAAALVYEITGELERAALMNARVVVV